MIEIKRFKHFEDVLIDVPKDIVKFGEYRKGSDKYGVMISSIMDWLRLHKSKGDTVNRIEVEKNKFFSQTNIKEVDFLSFLKEKNKINLVSFDIQLFGDKVVFDDLNKRQKNLPWENKSL